jgi:hypothetical protein
MSDVPRWPAGRIRSKDAPNDRRFLLDNVQLPGVAENSSIAVSAATSMATIADYACHSAVHLLLAVEEVRVDCERLERVAVTPAIQDEVSAASAESEDARLSGAVAVLAGTLSGRGTVDTSRTLVSTTEPFVNCPICFELARVPSCACCSRKGQTLLVESRGVRVSDLC